MAHTVENRSLIGTDGTDFLGLPRFKQTLLSITQASHTHRSIARAERDGTRAETIFRLSLKRTSPFKSVGASVQSTAGSRGVRISLSNAG